MRFRLSAKALGVSAALAVLALGAGLALWGSSEAPYHENAVAETAPVGNEGMRVEVDAEHGIVPHTHANPPETPRRSLGKSAAKIEVIEHPGGMRSAVLPEAYMSTSVACINADGSVETECFDSAEEVEAFLSVDRSSTELEVR